MTYLENHLLQLSGNDFRNKYINNFDYMFSAFITGFFLGLSLIMAIGAQNAFVLRQGILRQHVFYIALFCSISDTLLIVIGTAGISYFLNDFINEYSKIIYSFAAIWLFAYGFFRLRSVLNPNLMIIANNSDTRNLINTISLISILTFTNPHVYLDTVILIGSISQQFMSFEKVYFTFGACIASFIWFFGLAYGSKLLTPIMKSTRNWQILDTIIAMIMIIIGLKLASQSGWF